MMSSSSSSSSKTWTDFLPTAVADGVVFFYLLILFQSWRFQFEEALTPRASTIGNIVTRPRTSMMEEYSATH